jgi:hypothetical protein
MEAREIELRSHSLAIPSSFVLEFHPWNDWTSYRNHELGHHHVLPTLGVYLLSNPIKMSKSNSSLGKAENSIEWAFPLEPLSYMLD